MLKRIKLHAGRTNNKKYSFTKIAIPGVTNQGNNNICLTQNLMYNISINQDRVSNLAPFLISLSLCGLFARMRVNFFPLTSSPFCLLYTVFEHTLKSPSLLSSTHPSLTSQVSMWRTMPVCIRRIASSTIFHS